MDSTLKPSLQQMQVSLVPWFILMFGISVIRLETKYWVNMTMLSAVYPMMIWFLSNKNLLLSLRTGSAWTTITTSILLLIALTEGVKWQKLKDNFKKFGKDPKQTAITTSVVMATTMIGLAVAYVVQGGDVLHM